jgi:hypothetical protein
MLGPATPPATPVGSRRKLMAWTDDRLWCHPKYVGLTVNAKLALRHSFEYASGMSTHGKLTAAQQSLVGAKPATRRELIAAGWWDLNGDGETVMIHDWDEHNGVRDERKAKARERMRAYRAQNK